MSKVLLERKTEALNNQVRILIDSVVDYMERAKYGLQELKKIQRIKSDKLDEERLNEFESAFNSLKDIFVLGAVEAKIPVLIDGIREILES